MTGHAERSLFFLSQRHPQLIDEPGAGMEGTRICLESGLFLVSTKMLHRPAVILSRNISAASTPPHPPYPPAPSPSPLTSFTWLTPSCSGGKTARPQKPSLLHAPEDQPPFLQSSNPSVPLPLIPVTVPVSLTQLDVSGGSPGLSTGPRQELRGYC